MSALETMVKQAAAGQEAERKVASRANKAFYAFAIGGFAVRIAAGLAAVLDSVITAGVCGVLAGAAAAGLQSVISPRERAIFHFVNSANLGEIANLGTILSERKDPPSKDELDDLAARIAEVQRRKYRAAQPPS